MVLKWIWWYFS